MDSSLSYLLKKPIDDRNTKESEFCGPIHRSGDCHYVNCSYSVDHYHCQICGNGSVEASEALSHIRSSPSCRRDSQYPNDQSSLHTNAYNAFYGGLTAQNSLCSSSYSGYGQLDSFQWLPTVPVDKMAICGPQLSPCFSAPTNDRLLIDPAICSPISDLFTKVSNPVKDLVNLPAKSSGTPSESQPWFYNNQSLFKYVEQSSLPQLNFLLLDPPVEQLSNDLLPYLYSNKSECNSNQREKDPFLPFCSQPNLQPGSSDDCSSLFNLQLQDKTSNSKHTDLFSNEQSSALSICAQECSSKDKSSSCCMLMEAAAGTSNTDITSFTEFESGNISEGDQCSSGSESDIIVEDTDQLSEVAQSQISIENIKCSLLKEVEDAHKSTENFSSLAMDIPKATIHVEEHVGCAICNEQSPGSVLTQLGSQLPVTSTSHTPVLLKLAQLVNLSASDVLNTYGGLLCQQCLSLFDAVDSLESQLDSARQAILQMFKVAGKSGGAVLTDSDIHLTNSEIQGRNSNLEGDAISLQSIAAVSPMPDNEINDEIVDTFSAEHPTSTDDVSNIDSVLKEQTNIDSVLKEHTNIDSVLKEQTNIEKAKEKYDFICDYCGLDFATLPALNGHLAVHKQADSKFLCQVCGRQFQYRQQHQIDHHLSLHFPAVSLNCEDCNKGFKSKRALQEHSKVHSGERPFSCPNCDRRFAHSSNMRAHFKLCSGDLPFRCDNCKAGFSSSSGLDRHIALVHVKLLAFKCTQCNRSFSKLSDFRTHQRVHSTHRSYTCPVCDRNYKSLSSLNQHTKSHGREKPFNCVICNQGFLRKDAWQSHMLSHTDERPFKCSQCPKAFWSKLNLSSHSKRHAGTHKKNKCPVCDKTFSQKLSVHMRTHTGERPHRCTKCLKAFSTGSSLNKHVLLKHPKVLA